MSKEVQIYKSLVFGKGSARIYINVDADPKTKPFVSVSLEANGLAVNMFSDKLDDLKRLISTAQEALAEVENG